MCCWCSTSGGGVTVTEPSGTFITHTCPLFPQISSVTCINKSIVLLPSLKCTHAILLNKLLHICTPPPPGPYPSHHPTSYPSHHPAPNPPTTQPPIPHPAPYPPPTSLLSVKQQYLLICIKEPQGFVGCTVQSVFESDTDRHAVATRRHTERDCPTNTHREGEDLRDSQTR